MGSAVDSCQAAAAQSAGIRVPITTRKKQLRQRPSTDDRRASAEVMRSSRMFASRKGMRAFVDRAPCLCILRCLCVVCTCLYKGNQIGTTKRGIGPAYASKATRNGLRVCDLLNMETFATKLRTLSMDGSKRFGDNYRYDVEKDIAYYKGLADAVKPYITDTVDYLNTAYEGGKRILIEGANATMLDLDFGTYPFVTSSNPSIGGIATGLGLAPNKYGALIGVVSSGMHTHTHTGSVQAHMLSPRHVSWACLLVMLSWACLRQIGSRLPRKLGKRNTIGLPIRS